MAKYSKRVREDAALICGAKASFEADPTWPFDYLTAGDAARSIRALEAPLFLAYAAATAARQAPSPVASVADMWAEAEALIRTGWTP